MTANRPIFLLSVERSGSTLLRYLLDTHPEIGAPGELALGQLSAELMRVLMRTHVDHQEAGRSGAAEVRGVIDGIMSAYLSRVGKRIWCDKAPVNLRYLDELAEVFPDAHFICLYRTCLDTAYSSFDASRYGFMAEHRSYVAKHPENIILAMVENWLDKTECLVEFERTYTRQSCRIRYEDLVFNADGEMQKLMRSLGLEWDSALLEAALVTPHLQGGGDKKIHEERSIHHRSVGSGQVISMRSFPLPVVKRINRLLRELHYPELPLTPLRPRASAYPMDREACLTES